MRKNSDDVAQSRIDKINRDARNEHLHDFKLDPSFGESVREILKDSRHKSVLIVAGNKADASMNFVMLFPPNLKLVLLWAWRAKININMGDLLVLNEVFDEMRFGNHLQITQIGIAKSLNIDKSAVNRSYKKLEKIGIFHCNNGHLSVNQNLFLKGRSRDFHEAFSSDAAAGMRKLESLGIVGVRDPFIKIRGAIDRSRVKDASRLMSKKHQPFYFPEVKN